jgi:hypothetical protein
MNGIHAPIRIQGKLSLRGSYYMPGVDLTGCVSVFVVRNLVNGQPSGAARLSVSSEDDDGQLTIGEVASANTYGGKTVAAGDGVLTIDLDPATIEAIPAGTYIYAWKIIWPASGGFQRKTPISYGAFVREVTINEA